MNGQTKESNSDDQIQASSSTGIVRPSRYSIAPGAYPLLEKQAEELCESALSENTRNAYKVGFHTFCQFLQTIGIAADDYCPPPMSEQILIYFVTHCCKTLNLSHSTIKLYLAAVRFHYVKTGVPNPLCTSNDSCQKLQAVLRGIQKQRFQKEKRRPITYDI